MLVNNLIRNIIGIFDMNSLGQFDMTCAKSANTLKILTRVTHKKLFQLCIARVRISSSTPTLFWSQKRQWININQTKKIRTKAFFEYFRTIEYCLLSH